MSELISGKEAAQALIDGKDVWYIGHGFGHEDDSKFGNAVELSFEDVLNDRWLFKLKPRTITINGIEVPAPFDPKEGEHVWLFSSIYETGYTTTKHKNWLTHVFGAWRTEEEIQQVVAALRSVFKV